MYFVSIFSQSVVCLFLLLICLYCFIPLKRKLVLRHSLVLMPTRVGRSLWFENQCFFCFPNTHMDIPGKQPSFQAVIPNMDQQECQS